MASPARSDLELGVVRWINSNRTEAKRHKVDILDIRGAPQPTIDIFCDRTGVTRETLEELGREARARGCVRDDTEKVFQLSRTRKVSVLRSVGEGWQQIDGTVERGPRDDATRYTVGPRWKASSCWMDSILFCALMLDAGRIQIDQLPPSVYAGLGVAAMRVRQVVATPWGTLQQTQRDSCRDTLLNVMAGNFPNEFPLGEYADVKLALEKCFEGLPQLSFTALRARICCDAVKVAYNDHQAERRTNVTLSTNNSSMSAQEILTSWLTRRPIVTDGEQSCTNGTACTRKQQRLTLIVDRMPPILMVFPAAPITQTENAGWRLFEPLDLTYETTKGSTNIRYEPLGCVIMRNWNHYVVRWLAKDPYPKETPFIQYDGMEKSGRISYKSSWWAGVVKGAGADGKRHAGVITMFYRQVERKEL